MMFPPDFETKRTSVLDLGNLEKVTNDMKEVVEMYSTEFKKCKAACESDGDYEYPFSWSFPW